ncbi:MAG: DUF3108 domain-containing protein [Parvibaculum sp.]|uniref:DUF3108 domain-containing protein n=1 Tax=Parvibaculum sp. TaxID=2024848 RepID=UPI0032EAC826
MVQTTLRFGWKTTAVLALAIGAAGLMPQPSPLAAAPAPAVVDVGKSGLQADYTVYIGGFKAAEGMISATLREEGYALKSFLGIAGIPKNFFDARWTMESEGHFSDARPQPERFAFHSDEKGKIKLREMVYDASGRPDTTFEPPLEPHDEIRVLPHEQQDTLDPVSALLVPVAAGDNPCNRTIRVFDGKRRYDLQLDFDKEGALATRDNGYSGKAIRCSVRMIPRSAMRHTSFTRMLQQRDNAHIWLAAVNDGSIYIPVRIQVRTPIGGAIMDVVKLRQYAAAQ